MSSPLIVDSAQRRRSAMPNTFGMNPAIAERLASFGVDPRELANRIAGNRDAMNARADAAFASAIPVTVHPRRIPVQRQLSEMSLDPSDVSQQMLLNESALGSFEDSFIQDELAPVQLVNTSEREGTFFVSSRSADRAQVDDTLASGGRATRVPSGLSRVEFSLQDYGLESDVNDLLAMERPRLENVVSETERLGQLVFLQQELRVVRTGIFTSTNYASACRRALSAGYNWNGGANAAPVADMHAVIAAMDAPPTHAVFSLETWQATQQNMELREMLLSQPNNGGLLAAGDFGMYFGIPNVVVNRGQYMAVGGSSMSRVVSDTALAILHVSPDPQRRSFARQIRMRNGANGIVVTTWFDKAPGVQGFTRIKVAHSSQFKVIDNRYGGIITGMRA